MSKSVASLIAAIFLISTAAQVSAADFVDPESLNILGLKLGDSPSEVEPQLERLKEDVHQLVIRTYEAYGEEGVGMMQISPTSRRNYISPVGWVIVLFPMPGTGNDGAVAIKRSISYGDYRPEAAENMNITPPKQAVFVAALIKQYGNPTTIMEKANVASVTSEKAYFWATNTCTLTEKKVGLGGSFSLGGQYYNKLNNIGNEGHVREVVGNIPGRGSDCGPLLLVTIRSFDAQSAEPHVAGASFVLSDLATLQQTENRLVEVAKAYEESQKRAAENKEATPLL